MPLFRLILCYSFCFFHFLFRLIESVDLWVKIGECVANIAVELPDTCFVGRHVWLGCVVDEVVREKLFENVEPSFSLDLFGIPPYHGLSCVRRCDGSHIGARGDSARCRDEIREWQSRARARVVGSGLGVSTSRSARSSKAGCHRGIDIAIGKLSRDVRIEDRI